MACRTVAIPGHGLAIVCSRSERRKPPRRCVVCNQPEWLTSIKLCDGPREGGQPGQTCDAVLCLVHAHHVEPDTDYCPRHVPRG
jgi:hypothetical protein